MMNHEDEQTIDERISALQPEISYCEDCQSWDPEDQEIVWMGGNRASMRDFLKSKGVPSTVFEDLATRLQCQNCGETLDINKEIGLKTHAEKRYEERWSQWEREYKARLNDFTAWLARFPYLGCGHEIGKQFLKEIREFPVAGYVAERWWRARPVESPRQFTSGDMGPPPDPPKSEGRYNHHGQRVFYFASEKRSAATEVLQQGESLVWLQEFQVATTGRILDLTRQSHPEDLGDVSLPMLAVGLNWSDAHMEPDDPNSEWKPQYFLPRYIADCARSAGFRGIAFDSARHFATNLVLFEWDEGDIIPVGSPEVLHVTPDQLNLDRDTL